MNQREKMLAMIKSPWFTLSFLTAITISFIYFDRPIAVHFAYLDWGKQTDFFHHVTNLALSGFYLTSLALLAIFFRYVNKNKLWSNRAWFLWLSVAIPAVVVLILKMVFGRARPELFIHHDLYGFFWFQTQASYWSFPSGHTTTIMGLMAGFAFLFPKFRYAFIGTGLLIAFTRIILQRHFLSDILVASYLSIIEVALIYFIVKRNNWLQPIFNDNQKNMD